MCFRISKANAFSSLEWIKKPLSGFNALTGGLCHMLTTLLAAWRDGAGGGRVVGGEPPALVDSDALETSHLTHTTAY